MVTNDIFDLIGPEEEKEPEQETLPVVKVESTDLLIHEAQEAGVAIPEEKVAAIVAYMDRAKHGHQAALPMKCKRTCPFKNMCPLVEQDLQLPLGKACPVEKALVGQWVGRTVQALDIDVDNPEQAVDLDMVYELAGLELIRMRAANHMSDDPALVSEKIVGYSPQGQPIYDEKPKGALLILERHSKIVNKLREQLVATRKSQIQAGKFAGDLSVRSAGLAKKAREKAAARAASRKAAQAEEAEFEVKE